MKFACQGTGLVQISLLCPHVLLRCLNEATPPPGWMPALDLLIQGGSPTEKGSEEGRTAGQGKDKGRGTHTIQGLFAQPGQTLSLVWGLSLGLI